MILLGLAILDGQWSCWALWWHWVVPRSSLPFIYLVVFVPGGIVFTILECSPSTCLSRFDIDSPVILGPAVLALIVTNFGVKVADDSQACLRVTISAICEEVYIRKAVHDHFESQSFSRHGQFWSMILDGLPMRVLTAVMLVPTVRFGFVTKVFSSVFITCFKVAEGSWM